MPRGKLEDVLRSARAGGPSFRIANDSKLGAVLSAAAFGVYSAVVVIGAPAAGVGIAAFAVLPVVVTGFLLGTRAGVLAAFIAFALNNALLILIVGGRWELTRGGGLSVGIALVFIGAVIGKLHDLLAGISSLHQQLEAQNAAAHRLVSLIRASLDAADDGMVVIGADGRLEMLNRPFGDIFGISAEDFEGRPVADLRPVALRALADPDAFFKLVRMWPSDSRAPVVGMLVQLYPEERELELTSRPILDEGGQLLGRLDTFRDVTQQRAMARMKDEFISIVSHELRTPIASIHGALGLLANGLLGPIPARAQRMLEIAVTNTDRAARLLDEILDVDRLESSAVRLDKRLCNASDLMQHAADAIQTYALKAGVRVEVNPIAAELVADPDRMHQLLTNLLTNAVKFSEAGGRVRLAASSAGSDIIFEVADEGRGIPRSQLDLVFDRFHQVDASDSRKKGGTGLGLTICRAIVQQHGGRIIATSPGLGKGSTFIVQLPTNASVSSPAVGILR